MLLNFAIWNYFLTMFIFALKFMAIKLVLYDTRNFFIKIIFVAFFSTIRAFICCIWAVKLFNTTSTVQSFTLGTFYWFPDEHVTYRTNELFFKLLAFVKYALIGRKLHNQVVRVWFWDLIEFYVFYLLQIYLDGLYLLVSFA